MAKAGRVSAAISQQPAPSPYQTTAECEEQAVPRSEVARVRSELFVEFVRGMNRSGIPYCLVSGYENYPRLHDSDVDFMVRSEDAPRIGPLLHDVANRCGGLLVQAIQHETAGCYHVLAKQVGDHVAYLHPDCATDYRRDGRLWLRADEVIRNRRRFRTFFVPAVADEFQYYLIKKILKQQITRIEFQRVAALYVSRPEECCERLRHFWSTRTTRALVSAIVTADIEWIQPHLRDLLEELRRSRPLENVLKRGVQRFHDWHRRTSRVFHPTGLSVSIRGGNEAQRWELATGLERNLRPAFRRTEIIPEGQSDGRRVSASALLSTVRSTLIIRKDSRSMWRWFAPSGICFDLSETGRPTIEGATEIVLQLMANRLQRRIA